MSLASVQKDTGARHEGTFFLQHSLISWRQGAKYLDDDQRVLRAVQGGAQHVGHAGVQLEEGVALGAGGDLHKTK